MNQIRLRGAQALATAFVSISTFALAQPADVMGPPLVTVNGCHSDQIFTRAYVAKAIGVDEGTVRRMLSRYAITPSQACVLEPDALKTLVAHTRTNKFGFDEPESAIAYRKLSYLDESGDIRPNGLGIAIQQRQDNVRASSLKGAISPKAAGVTSASWTALGPFNAGGRVRAIAPHPTIANRILVGGVSGGIWKSVNGGGSWTPVNDFMASVAISCLIHDPNNASVVYACTGEGAFNTDAIRGLGLFKSIDAGDTWTQVASTNPGTAPVGGTSWYYVNRLAIDPSNSLVMLAATNGGVYRTADGGATWTAVYGNSSPVRRVYDVKFNTTTARGALGTQAVLGEHRYFDGVQFNGGATAWSADHGATWTRVPILTPPLGSNQGRVEIAYSASTGNFIVQVDFDSNLADGQQGGQLFRSINGGQSWTFISEPGKMGNQGWYDNAIWVDPTNESKIIIGGGGAGIFMSVDSGITFTQIGQGVHVDHHAIVNDPGYAGNGIVYNGNDGGVYKFTGVQNVNNSTSLPSITNPPASTLNNGLPITQFYGGAGGKVPATRLVGGTQDNGTWAYNSAGATWVQIAGGDGGENAVDPVDTAYLFGEFQWLAVHRNTGGGVSPFSSQQICMTITDSGCSNIVTPPNTNFISPIAVDPSSGNRLYAGSVALWRSNNAKDPTPANVVFSVVKAASATPISFIAVSPTNPDIVWIGDNGGGVFRTVNATAVSPTWTGNLSPISGRQVLRILIDKDDPARVYVTYGGFTTGNVQFTSNGLNATPTWADKSGTNPNALPQAPVRALTRHPANALWLYAGTEVGLFTSQDGGTSWFTTNDGPGTVSVEEIFFLDAATLVASTHGRGMFQAAVTPPATSPGTIQLSASAVSVAEGGSVTLGVSRIGGSSGAVGVTASTANGTATAGADYVAIPGQVISWADGDSASKSVTVNTLTDALVEGSENFTLNIATPTGGASLGTPASTTITILDPDVFPVGCVMPAGWTVPVTAASGWSVDNGSAFEGSCSLRSNAILDAQKAQIQFIGVFAAGNVTFNARVSAERTWDCLHFSIDGAEKNIGTNCTGGNPGGGGLGLTGAGGGAIDTGWQAFSIPVSAGSHTLLFSYDKDPECCFEGADAGWIDNVVLPLPPTTFPLTVTKAGIGVGTVTSSPSGIACGATCVFSFNSATVVTLTAAAQSGSVFTGWSGAGCSGTGTCVITLGAVTGVTASFGLVHFNDLNGDGNADLLWRDTSIGSVQAWLMNGLTATSIAGLLPAGGYTVSHVADLDGDGKSDLIITHTDGTIIGWIMNGLAVTGQATLSPAGSGWSVVKTGDLNGDGKKDLILQHTDGRVQAWLMNGLTVTSTATFVGAGSGWSVSKVADLDGDGKADLVWQNTDGSVQAWLMNGLAVTQVASLAGAGSGWSVVLAGDLSGDGKADLVWQHTDGRTQAWIMNGLSVTSLATFTPAGTGWTPILIGDINGDGRGDLFWQHSTGASQTWLMNGTTATSIATFTGAGPWSVSHLVDLNGDGKKDLLWRNTDGSVQAWIMNGLTVSQVASLAPPGTYRVIP